MKGIAVTESMDRKAQGSAFRGHVRVHETSAADKEGTLSLNLYWLKRVCEFAKEIDRIPVFWDDMPLKEGGVYESTWSDEVTSEEAEKAWKEGTPKLDKLLEDFPKNCVYMRWNYSMARQELFLIVYPLVVARIQPFLREFLIRKVTDNH